MELDVLTLGEAMVLFAADEAGTLAQVERFRRFVAGAELNVAIGLSRLGLRAGYLSRLGKDAFGRVVLDTLAAEGITPTLVAMDEQHPTGFMLKSLELDGRDPQIEYHRRGSAASCMGVADLQRLQGVRARHLHVTGISPALSPSCRELTFEAIRWARRQGMTVSFDPNLRPRLWPSEEDMTRTVNELAALCDWVMPGLAEGQRLTGLTDASAIARFYLTHGSTLVAVKLGPQGAWCEQQDGKGWLVPGVAVARVVDTVGAGDGFGVGLISGMLDGLTPPQAVARGNLIGARVVQFPGDSDGLPTRQELDQFAASV